MSMAQRVPGWMLLLFGVCVLLAGLVTLAKAPAAAPGTPGIPPTNTPPDPGLFTIEYEIAGSKPAKLTSVNVIHGDGPWTCTVSSDKAACKTSQAETAAIAMTWTPCENQQQCVILSGLTYTAIAHTRAKPLGVIARPKTRIVLAESTIPASSAGSGAEPVGGDTSHKLLEQKDIAELTGTINSLQQSVVVLLHPRGAPSPPEEPWWRQYGLVGLGLLALVFYAAFSLYLQWSARNSAARSSVTQRIATDDKHWMGDQKQPVASRDVDRLAHLIEQLSKSAISQRDLERELNDLQRALSAQQRSALDELSSKLEERYLRSSAGTASRAVSASTSTSRTHSEPVRDREPTALAASENAATLIGRTQQAAAASQKLAELAAEYRDALPDIGKFGTFMQKYQLTPLQRCANEQTRLTTSPGGMDKAQFWGVPLGAAGAMAILLNRNLWTQVERLTALNWEGARDVCGGIFELSAGNGFLTRPAVAVPRNGVYEVTTPGKLELAGSKTQ